MQIRDIFLQPIDRFIEGVIKADDRSNLLHEVEEYVITDEIRSKLTKFVDDYLNEVSTNGVWISGFFGSGKSHLLKMLSLLLENWQVEGFSILDNFSNKCQKDEILIGDLRKLAKIPAKSILFNIAQKANLISNKKSDALLSVFIKVFDEYCGYYGKQGYIARFERDLDKRELFTAFKEEYKAISGKDWVTGREEVFIESANISRAYEIVSGNSETNILDKYRDDYQVSIEDFAVQVRDYINNQEAGFRLIFLVDEVGQFVADNTTLMLNLQTIVESLATICHGRAWVVVTSQADLEAVVGEISQRTGNDFSKILGRFRTTINLSSDNVDEVIQKRLLLKNEGSWETLGEIYHTHVHNFQTMFGFVDGTPNYRNFEDKEDFINIYPFIPYQFTLFQKAIMMLSQNHFFQGRYSSVGERSMLGVFQLVLKNISPAGIGCIATFDLMFDGIRASIQGQLQTVIANAENHLGDNFAIKVLKILFMLKYIRNFKATIANVSILLMPDFEADITILRSKVQEALTRLESQTYIQRNGEFYEFLTNEEKDIEKQIKNTSIDNINLLDKVDEIIFSSAQIVKNLKIRYDKSKQDFPYTRRIDKKQYGREYEISIQIITPYNDYYDFDDDTQIIFHAYGKPELTILLPPDNRFWDDLKIYLQTEKCYSQNFNSMQSESAKRILSTKRDSNKSREKQIKDRLAELICSAKLYACGETLDIENSDANQRIIQAFQMLVEKVYPNLAMLINTYTEIDIAKSLDTRQMQAGFAYNLTEAEQEVYSHLSTFAGMGRSNSLQDIMEKFSRKPYGWGFYAILCQVASLYSFGKIELFADGEILEGSALEKSLKNTQKHGILIIKIQQEYTASQIRGLKDLYHTLFNSPIDENDPKSLAGEFSKEMSEKTRELEDILKEINEYPFVKDLVPLCPIYKNAIGKHHSWYYTELLLKEDELCKDKQELIDPMLAFWHSEQKSIYDEVRVFIKEQDANFIYLDTEKINELQQTFNDPLIYKGNRIQKIKILLDILADKSSELIKNERIKAIEVIDNALDYEKPDVQIAIDPKAALTKSRIAESKLIAVIKDLVNLFLDKELPEIRKAMKPKTTTPGKKAGSRINFIDIATEYSDKEIGNEEELKKYIKSLQKALISELNKGNIIELRPKEER
jgi:uncharacterized protein (DUF1499 family)